MAVPEGRIFLINSMGELHNINHTYRQTYLSLSRQVDLTFPPLPHDGADDAFDGHDTDADDHDHDHHHHLGAYEADYPSFGHTDNGDLVDAGGNSDNGKSGGGGGGASFSGLPESTSSSSSSVTAAAAGGAGGASADSSAQDTSGSGKVSALADESGDAGGSTGGGGGIGGGGSAAKTTVPIPRRWEEVAPRREKSFYPNRAAVEDRFTDLNFWRDPPPLIGDDDDDDDDDEDDDDSDGDGGDESQEDGENEGAGGVQAPAVATKRVLVGPGALEVRGGKIGR